MKGASGTSDIEHVAIGKRAGRPQRRSEPDWRVAGASADSASDQRKDERVSIKKFSVASG